MTLNFPLRLIILALQKLYGKFEKIYESHLKMIRRRRTSNFFTNFCQTLVFEQQFPWVKLGFYLKRNSLEALFSEFSILEPFDFFQLLLSELWQSGAWRRNCGKSKRIYSWLRARHSRRSVCSCWPEWRGYAALWAPEQSSYAGTAGSIRWHQPEAFLSRYSFASRSNCDGRNCGHTG